MIPNAAPDKRHQPGQDDRVAKNSASCIFGPFQFRRVIDGVALHMEIAPTGAKRYAMEAEARDANLRGTTNPMPVTLAMGDDSGTVSVKADIDQHLTRRDGD